MKSILIIGTKDGGKSTTITEICKRLKPSEVYKLDTSEKKLVKANVTNIFNNTFIIKVNGKYILVVAGAPTEQNIMLKILIQITIELNIKISFLIVAKRTSERKKGFNTNEDIDVFTTLIHTERLDRISLKDQNDLTSFKQNKDWIDRINKLEKLVIENI
ncbi:hypothetical protein [Tenacibaculum ovolyticum]|uniref:hypothetical protein n=1 Tax=Tenacibaculum ovolyticum TaxID=104270 RepID=UPI001F1BDBE7|nr:hypothetical protein [Tenacibaculum ovolyticum]